MTTIKTLRSTTAAVALLILAGCAVTPSASQRAPSAEETAELGRVKDDYGAGRYGEVIRRVARSDVLASAPDATRIEALKLQSFSYCMSNYAQLCRDGFSRILQLDPNFTLAPSEAGHPQWGPVFEQARAAR
ncbi:hypothetical protein CEG14_09450 [Bordetella genomosp. 1]|uniref:Lipoprotein n=1 Tax=Bordetella genomosp. 1 TaxID=1395607 RepID=A0A261SD86_9BORD|nr:TssQ family T6SS-associated lipoprotein [Bordetella genomosp. 1]OZI35316.1 hypothetical protein CEG14_09450 [Bordetella genomosp. 1]OZI63856.1 hypothetical protein CAL27_14760 [Bordetella genomosp. 1]